MNHQHWSPAFKRSKDGTRNKNICLLIQLFSQNLPNIAYNQIISHHIHTLFNTFELASYHCNLYEISPTLNRKLSKRQLYNTFLMAHTHCMGPEKGQGMGNDRFRYYCYVLYTLHRDRDRHKEPLFSIVVIPVPVPVLVPVPCSVYESLPIN